MYRFQVSPDDSLPQFICQHCLGYLQHAYEMRLKIKSNNANLRTAQRIANDQSVYLERSQIDQTRITKREVTMDNEEELEESHFFSQFQDADIKINPRADASQGATIRQRAIEHKCNSCGKRIMSIKSLNDHLEICEIVVLDSFFSELQRFFSMRYASEITMKEFILYAIKLVFDTQAKLQRILKQQKVDIGAINFMLPQDLSTQQTLSPKFLNKRVNPSPDNGYTSGGNSCAPR